MAPVCPDAKLRKLVRNMIYDGVVAQLLSIEMDEVHKALVKQFGKRKAKAADLNWGAAQAGFDYAAKTFTKTDPFRVERMNATAGKIIIEGNAACALGAMFAGVTVVTWYPITPSSSLVETLIGYMKRFRMDPETGKATYAIVQAEDELASIGMALGAGWAGARSMTATAGPGISLMSEFVGLGYYAEVPAVIFDVERVGPSTGLPTRTQQGDLLTTAILSHGDTKHPMFFPCSPEECFTMAIDAFDFAERFQTPVFVMTDLDLGMNNWMADPFPYPEKPIRPRQGADGRGSRTGWAASRATKMWMAMASATAPCPAPTIPRRAYFTRGSGHNEKAQYTEREDDYINNMDRLAHKFEVMRQHVPEPGGATFARTPKSASSPWAPRITPCAKAATSCKTEYDIAGQLPAPEGLSVHRRICWNSSAATSASTWWIRTATRSCWALMRLELDAELIAKLRSVRYYGGLPLDARTVTDEIVKQEGK